MIPSAKKLYELNQSGVSEQELADRYSTTRNIVHGKIYRYKKRMHLDIPNQDDDNESVDVINKTFEEYFRED